MHWQLDVTFREYYNETENKTATQNLNILCKFVVSILKLLDIGRKASLKKKRFAICLSPAVRTLEQVLCF